MVNSFICLLTFKNDAEDPIKHEIISKGVNLLQLGSFNWSRGLNKNAVYVNLPVEKPDEGGYGYDLGFLQDDFTLEVSFYDFDWYRKIFMLAKSNVGEVTATLMFGFPPAVDEYNVIIRSINISGDDGGTDMKLSIRLTIVSKEYNK